MEEESNQGTRLETAPPGEPQGGSEQSLFQPASPTERVIQEHGLAKYRIAAKLIDVIPLTLFELTVFFIFFNSPEGQPESAGVALVGFFIIWQAFAVIDVLYFFSFEYFSQATPGKKIFSLKVIDYMKGRPGAPQILGRAILTAISIHSFLWLIELIAMLMDKNGLRIADHAAGTKVIRVRTVSAIPARVPGSKV